MALWPNKREIGGKRQDRVAEHINKMEKVTVLAMIALGTAAAICAAIFGHNWTLPS